MPTIIEHWTPIAVIGGAPYYEDGNGNFLPLASSGSGTIRARNVITTNVDIAAFPATTFANNDNVTNEENDVILLAAQTTPNQNGVWVVGPVDGGGHAPLSRPSYWATGAQIQTGVEVWIGAEGAVYGTTIWVPMLSDDFFIVDTADPNLYPRMLTGQANLGGGESPAGRALIQAPIFGVNTYIGFTRIQSFGTTVDTVSYQPTDFGTPSITPGPIGTGQAIVNACTANGSINADDGSVLVYVIINQKQD